LINKNLDYTNKDIRTLVSQAFRIYSENIPEDKWINPTLQNKEFVKKLIDDDMLRNLAPDFNSLTELRNDVNHSGFVNPRSIAKIRGKIESIIKSYQSKLK